MHIQDFFQNFLKLFLVGLHGDCTIILIAQDMSPTSKSRSYPRQEQCEPLLQLRTAYTLQAPT